MYQQVIASNGENLNDYYQNISNHKPSEEAVFLKVEKNSRSANGWIFYVLSIVILLTGLVVIGVQ
ncbi:hypothetical protein EGLA_12780 [Enterococcus gallinarum]|nr:hypothetical protein AH4_07700 [Enterococcus gallinarum]